MLKRKPDRCDILNPALKFWVACYSVVCLGPSFRGEAEDQLLEVRFYVPPSREGDEDAAEVLKDVRLINNTTMRFESAQVEGLFLASLFLVQGINR